MDSQALGTQFRRFLQVAGIALALGCILACTRPEQFYLGGIQVNEADHQVWARSLKRAGYSAVSVTVYAHQGDWNSDTLWYDKENKGVVAEIRAAKREGLAVVLILRVALDHAYPKNQFLWHGMIMPSSEQSLANWFERYSSFVAQWAAIAESEGVDILGIGSELNSLTSTIPISSTPSLLSFHLDTQQQQQRIDRVKAAFPESTAERLWTRGTRTFSDEEQLLRAESEVKRDWALSLCGGSPETCVGTINNRRRLLQEHWKELIGKTRNIFSKKLIYAANFDQYTEVGFWDDIDFIGINAYFRLRPTIEAPSSTVDLVKGWQTVFSEIADLQKKLSTPKPVIFTELGYTFREHSSLEPWSSEGFSLIPSEHQVPKLLFWKEQPITYSERQQAIEALHQVACAHPGVLHGVLYWKLSTEPAHESIEPFVHILNSTKDVGFSEALKALRVCPAAPKKE
jgi:hypothetical protein